MPIGKEVTILVNGHDLACAFKDFNPSAEREEQDATVLCNAFRSFESGFVSAEIEASGVWKYDATLEDQIHEVLSSAFQAGSELMFTGSFAPIVVGDPAVMMNTIERQFAVNIPQGELIMVDAAFRANTPFDAGRWLMNTQLNAGTTNGTNVDHGASTNTGAMFHVHLHNNTASDVDVILQHSVDNSVWVDLTSVLNLSAVRAYGYAEIASGVTINRHLRARAIVTGGNTVLVSAAVARRF